MDKKDKYFSNASIAQDQEGQDFFTSVEQRNINIAESDQDSLYTNFQQRNN